MKSLLIAAAGEGIAVLIIGAIVAAHLQVWP
jgi:hypothetical protein